MLEPFLPVYFRRFMPNYNGDIDHNHNLKVIEMCTNFYFGTEKLPPKF